MPDFFHSSTSQRRLFQDEVNNYLDKKEKMERAKLAYDVAKEAYDKGKKHDDDLKAAHRAARTSRAQPDES